MAEARDWITVQSDGDTQSAITAPAPRCWQPFAERAARGQTLAQTLAVAAVACRPGRAWARRERRAPGGLADHPRRLPRHPTKGIAGGLPAEVA
jgi:hypothetical protein